MSKTQTTTNSDPIPWSTHDKQEAFCSSTARYRTLVAGRRFGKNHAAIVSQADFILHPDAYPHGRSDPDDVVVWWIGPTYTQTRKYGFEKAKEALREAARYRGQPDDHFIDQTRATQPFEIHIPNGAVWEFYSYDRPQSLDGGGVDDMTIDERGYMDTSVWETNLASMLLDADGRVAFIGKPWHNSHFQETFEKGQDPEHENYDSWQATSYDNPRIPDERIDEVFGDLPEQVYRREILADFEASGNLLTLDMLEYADASVLDQLKAKNWLWHISVDLGVEMDAAKARENDTDYWALAVIAEHPRKAKAYVCMVRRRRGQAPSQAAEWIKDCIAWVPSSRVVYEKVQAQSWFETHLKDEHLDPVPYTPDSSKEDRIIGLSVPFSNGQVKLLDWSGVDGIEMDWSDFRTEWAGFPGGKVDQLDAVAQGLSGVTFGGNVFGEGMDLYGRDIDE